MKRILLAVDPSRPSSRAAAWVARHLHELGPDPALTLLNVDAPLLNAVRDELGQEGTARYHRENGRYATRMARRLLTRAGVRFTERLLVGHPAVDIARIAQREKFDLVVIGSRGEGAFKGLLVGSTVHKLLACSKVPVLVVP